MIGNMANVAVVLCQTSSSLQGVPRATHVTLTARSPRDDVPLPMYTANVHGLEGKF